MARPVVVPWALMIVAGCAQTETPTPSFTYHATAGWYVGTAPQVTSVAIDGQPLASGETYEVTADFATYDAAVATFQAREVVVTTASGAQTFTVAPGACGFLLPSLNHGDLIAEDDQYAALPGERDPSVIDFSAYCGRCVTMAETDAWCARLE